MYEKKQIPFFDKSRNDSSYVFALLFTNTKVQIKILKVDPKQLPNLPNGSRSTETVHINKKQGESFLFIFLSKKKSGI